MSHQGHPGKPGDLVAFPLPHHPCPRAEKGSKVDFFSCQEHLLVWRLAKAGGPVCAGCRVPLPDEKGPSCKLLVVRVTSEILVAYIVLDIDGEVDGQGVLALAQSSALL